MDLLADVGSCDPYDGGDEWCESAISAAEQRALDIQGTNIYCRWAGSKAETKATSSESNLGGNICFSADDTLDFCLPVLVCVFLPVFTAFSSFLFRCLARIRVRSPSRACFPSIVTLQFGAALGVSFRVSQPLRCVAVSKDHTTKRRSRVTSFPLRAAASAPTVAPCGATSSGKRTAACAATTATLAVRGRRTAHATLAPYQALRRHGRAP